MPPKELSEAVIGVSQAYQGTARLELLSPLAEFRWENGYTEPCMVLHLASEGDIVITASSVDFILISPHAICVKLLQPTSSRVTEHMRGDWQNNLNARNQAIILYLLPFDESKYLRFTNGNQVMYGNMESLRQLFEIKWAPYRGKEGFNQDNLGYIHARVDFRAQPFAEVISSRMFDFAFSDLVFPNNNHICQQIEKLSIVPQAKDESAIVVEDIIDILPMDTPASNGVNRKHYSPNENRKQTNGQLANDDNEPVEGEILVKYPSGKNGVDVHLRDMCRLPYNEMLNDTNIELGIKHILETNEEFSQSCHAFNTYFFGKLTQDGHRVNYRSPRARQQWIQGNYQNLKRWTRKVDVFEKEHLVVPINTELHWCVMIIKNPKALLSAKGEANTSKEPCLYIMLDSIPDSDEIRALGPEIMLDYLELEFQDKKKKNTNLVFCRGNMKKVVHKHNPVQKNFVDCGIYTLGFLENYATKPPSYKQKYEIDWTEYSPFFEITTVRYYREKLIKLIKNRAGEARWSRLEQFERTLGGVTNPSLESRVEAARKPRAHSFCLADWRQHENKVTKLRTKKKRAHSLPASSSTLISCKPIVIVRGENGVIKCPGI